MGVGGKPHAPAALPPGKSQCTLYRRLGGPQGRSGRIRKTSPPIGIRSPDRSDSLCRPTMSRSIIPYYQCFGGKNHPYLQGRKEYHVENVRVARGLSLYPEDGGSMFLRKPDVYLLDCTRSILGKQSSS